MIDESPSIGLKFLEEKYANHKEQPKIYESFIDTFGNTPLVKLKSLSEYLGLKTPILAKLELCNPLSSMKDRMAIAMIEAAEAMGKINQDTVIIEPVSDNVGVSLAFVCARKGYKLILTVPEGTSKELIKLYKMLGAQVFLTDKQDKLMGAMDKAEELLEKYAPNSIILHQFKNPANALINKITTGEEIWRDTDGNVDAVIMGYNTGGAITGIGQALKAHNKDIKMVAIEPKNNAVLSGGKLGEHKIEGIGPGFIPQVMDTSLIDKVVTISDDEAYEMTRLAISKEGITIGIADGASLSGALKLGLSDEFRDKNIVAIINNSAERSLSEEIFSDLD